MVWLQRKLIQLADKDENSSFLWHDWFALVSARWTDSSCGCTATKCSIRKAVQMGKRDRNQLVHSPAVIPNCSLKSSHAYPAILLFLPRARSLNSSLPYLCSSALMNIFSVQEVYFYLPCSVWVELHSSRQFQLLLISGLLVERLAGLNLLTSIPLWLLWTLEVTHSGNNYRLKCTAQRNCWESHRTHLTGNSLLTSFSPLISFYFLSRIIKSEQIMESEASEQKWKLWAKTFSVQFPSGQHRTNYWARMSHSYVCRLSFWEISR